MTVLGMSFGASAEPFALCIVIVPTSTDVLEFSDGVGTGLDTFGALIELANTGLALRADALGVVLAGFAARARTALCWLSVLVGDGVALGGATGFKGDAVANTGKDDALEATAGADAASGVCSTRCVAGAGDATESDCRDMLVHAASAAAAMNAKIRIVRHPVWRLR